MAVEQIPIPFLGLGPPSLMTWLPQWIAYSQTFPEQIASPMEMMEAAGGMFGSSVQAELFFFLLGIVIMNKIAEWF